MFPINDVYVLFLWDYFVSQYYYWNHACHKNYIVDDDSQIRRTRKKPETSKFNETSRGNGQAEAQNRRIKRNETKASAAGF
jgi:hypothetical protein